MTVQYDPALLKKLKKLNVRTRNRFFERIKIFEKNHQEPILNNHALKRDYEGYRSIDITNDYRAIYEEVASGEDEPVAYFIAIGTHKELFKI
ncbi:Bacterial toxin of type II toxin-antitoxin system, YafQ [uncultured archaeon]|nr:Bacterial toxin of type II toxin-antitoxin system, YafQ [uncultured archaeon]